MNDSSTNDLLNRLLVLHERSLPMYLSYAGADRLELSPKVAAAIGQMVEDQKRTVDRVATLILENNGEVDRGEFPMNFTGYNDLSVKFLLQKIIERQEKTVSAIEKIAQQLATAPYAQAAVREALGEAKGHLENLQEASAEPAAA
ncbi:MAG TPA: hypothetical protein VFB96_01620 [Pirellulaceae bacterium]|nr:hypothetical protein [Pirellulaceae bacterium]